MTDYRKLRINNLNSNEFRHVWLLLYWPAYGAMFWLLERGGITDGFYIVHCGLDDIIPFCELFVFPYIFWFVFLGGMVAYTFFFETDSFKKMMYFIMTTYTITLIIYVIFPTAQNLRPASFERDNILTRFMKWFYDYDTNTNVCPSLHVIGSVAVMAAAWNSRRFSTHAWRTAFTFMTVLISVSTLFLKQHSAIDVFAAIPMCVVAWLVVYRRNHKKSRKLAADTAV